MRDFLAALFTAVLALAAFAVLFFLYLQSPLYLPIGIFIPYVLYRGWLSLRRWAGRRIH